jgi:ribosome recycling factor
MLLEVQSATNNAIKQMEVVSNDKEQEVMEV